MNNHTINNGVDICNGVTLRPVDISDADDFFQWFSDARVIHNFGRWDVFTSKEAFTKYMVNTILPHPWMRAICINNRPVGCIYVQVLEGAHRCCAELDYMMAFKYWGKGIATRAAKLAATAVFEEFGHVKRLQAVAHVKNVASQRVLEKVGFQREGILRKYYLFKGEPGDAIMFSLLSAEFQPMKK